MGAAVLSQTSETRCFSIFFPMNTMVLMASILLSLPLQVYVKLESHTARTLKLNDTVMFVRNEIVNQSQAELRRQPDTPYILVQLRNTFFSFRSLRYTRQNCLAVLQH